MLPSTPSQRDIDDARALANDLRELLGRPQGASGEDCLEDVHRICEMARIAIEDPQCQALLQRLDRYAACFFVANDDVCWTWHTPRNYERLQQLLLRLVQAFDLRLTCLEIRGRSLEVSGRVQTAAPLRRLPQRPAASGVPR